MAKKVTKVHGMTPLQALIDTRMREKGWTPKDVESRGVRHATLHRYMNPVVLKQLPRRSVLEALAAGLELDVADVEQAAIESLTGRPAHPWRGSLEFERVDGDLDVAIVVERVDRMPISQEDLQRGTEAVFRMIDDHRTADVIPLPSSRAARKRPPKNRQT